MKYLIIPILLMSCILTAQEENKGTSIIEKSYPKLNVSPAYFDTNGVLQILAFKEGNSTMIKDAQKATMFCAYSQDGDTINTFDIASFTITIGKRRKDLIDFSVQGNEFKGMVLTMFSQLEPGDIVYFEKILIVNPIGNTRMLPSVVYKIFN